MIEKIGFGGNYFDLSSDRGCQFEFHCGRCAGAVGHGFQVFVTGHRCRAVGCCSWVLDIGSDVSRETMELNHT